MQASGESLIIRHWGFLYLSFLQEIIEVKSVANDRGILSGTVLESRRGIKETWLALLICHGDRTMS